MSRDIYTIAVPTWALNYVFNGGNDTITPAEKVMIDNFMADIEVISPPDTPPYFDAFPPFGLACDVYDCQVIYKQTKEVKQ